MARREAARRFAAERGAWLQQKVALQAGRRALEGELAKTRAQLAAAIELRAQKDSRIAQLRAEIEDSAWQFDRLRHDLLQAEQQAIEISQCSAVLCDEIARLRRINRSLAAEREARLAKLPGARLRALWQRFAERCVLPFRAGSARRGAPAKPE